MPNAISSAVANAIANAQATGGNANANANANATANAAANGGGTPTTTTPSTTTPTTNPAAGPHVDIPAAPATGPEIKTTLLQDSGATPMNFQQTFSVGGTLTGVSPGDNTLAGFGPASFLKAVTNGHATFLPEALANTAEINGQPAKVVIIPGTKTDVVGFDHANFGDVLHLDGGLTPPTAANVAQGTVTDANEGFTNHSALILSLGDNTTVALENVTATPAEISSWFA